MQSILTVVCHYLVMLDLGDDVVIYLDCKEHLLVKPDLADYKEDSSLYTWYSDNCACTRLPQFFSLSASNEYIKRYKFISLCVYFQNSE